MIRFTILLSGMLLSCGCVQQTLKTASSSVEDSVDYTMTASDIREANVVKTASERVTEPNSILTLRETLQLTLTHHPELKVYAYAIRAAEARALQAGLRPNPEFEVEMENLGGTGELSGTDAAETTLALSQLIELGDKAQKRKTVAAFETEVAGADYQVKKRVILSEGAKAFVEVLKAQETHRLSDQLLKLSEASFQTVRRRVEAGKDSPVEKNRASIELTNVKIAHRQAQMNLDTARKQLASFWSQEEPHFQEAVGQLREIEPLPPLKNVTQQLKQNPEYIRWESEIQKSRAALDLEHSKAIGDLSVGAGVRRYNATDDNAFVVGLSIPLPLFNRNQGGKKEAAYQLSMARQKQKAALRALLNDFNQTYQQCATAYHQALSLKNDVLPAAREMFNAAQEAYKQGKIDYMNVLDAQRTYFISQNEYVEILAAYHKAIMDMQRLIGQSIHAKSVQ